MLLVCVSTFPAAAHSLAKPALAPASNLYTASHQNYQDKKGDKAKKTENPETQKPEIKQVPKARKQLKPAAVKPKVKPIRIVKPRIKKH